MDYLAGLDIARAPALLSQTEGRVFQCPRTANSLDRRSYEIFGRLMSGEQFYINYSLNGEHYAMGPYHTRRWQRFASSVFLAQTWQPCVTYLV